MKRSWIIKVCLFLVAVLMIAAFMACEKSNGNKTLDSDNESIEDSENASESESESESEEPTETEKENLVLGDSVQYASNFKVSNVFDSNMVIQRNEYVRVWGFADESENGKKVTAEFMGKTADALIENGEWEIIFYQKHAACKELGNDLVVHNGSDVEYVFEDVLIGDVFMVIGQSNVQFSVNDYLSAEPDLKWTKDLVGENSIIRYNYNSNTQTEGYPKKGTEEVCKDAVNDYGWVIPTEQNVGNFSAVGYFVAHQIVELTKNDIPVGISQFSASGRTLSVFMPNELAEQLGSDQYSEEQGIYIGNYHSHVETRYMYNHYLYPFERMPIAGIVWYQGESESAKKLSTVYVERYTALLEYMRSTHNLVNKDFPVFYVEFPSVYNPEGVTAYLDTGRIRASSCMIPQSLSNSYIAVCSDLWDDEANKNNVHPYCKYEQAERISALIDAVIYGGQTMEEAAGPILESWELSEDRKTWTLTFSNCGDGLTTSDGGIIVNGFGATYIKNEIEKKIQIEAKITGTNTITVTSKKPFYGLAYNYIADNFFGEEINLCDSDGMPAHAFWIYVPEEIEETEE